MKSPKHFNRYTSVMINGVIGPWTGSSPEHDKDTFIKTIATAERFKSNSPESTVHPVLITEITNTNQESLTSSSNIRDVGAEKAAAGGCYFVDGDSEDRRCQLSGETCKYLAEDEVGLTCALKDMKSILILWKDGEAHGT